MSTSLIGKHFDNIGTIIAQTKLLNRKTREMVPCDIVCSSNQHGGTMHLIKEDNSSLSQVQQLFKTNPQILEAIRERYGCVITPTIEKVLEQNRRLATILKDMVIAEISYMKLCTEDDLRKVANLGYKKIDSDKDIIFLQNLIVNQKEYANASKTVAFPLLKKLSQKGLKNILIKASAFGENPQSPIHLYELNGFKPLGIKNEEVERHAIQTANGSRLDPNYKIMMYLPPDAILYDTLNKISPLEIDQINPNWLKI